MQDILTNLAIATELALFVSLFLVPLTYAWGQTAASPAPSGEPRITAAMVANAVAALDALPPKLVVMPSGIKRRKTA